VRCSFNQGKPTGTRRAAGSADCWVNVRSRSQTIMGRLDLSLYVGRITEYLCVVELPAIFSMSSAIRRAADSEILHIEIAFCFVAVLDIFHIEYKHTTQVMILHIVNKHWSCSTFRYVSMIYRLKLICGPRIFGSWQQSPVNGIVRHKVALNAMSTM
jgi:hypothetical protein